MSDANDSTRAAGEVLLTRAQVLGRVSMKRTWLRDAVVARRFPQPVHIGARVLWLEREIDAWIAQRVAERDARSPAA